MSKSLENYTDEEMMAFDNDESFIEESPVAEPEEVEVEAEVEVTEVEVSAEEPEQIEEAVEEADDSDEVISAQSTETENTEENVFEEDHTTPKQEAAAPDEEAEDETKEAAPAEEVDYKAAYESMMAPFKANGKDFRPESPEEVIRLAQQGANYVKKMTALKPNLRMMRMLENNGLLNEEKLGFLIDLNSGDQEAIKKFLKDKSVDPMDLDVDEEPTYQPKNHNVSDQEYAFSETLQDVMSNDGGPETVRTIQDHWDDRSKEAVYKDPSILALIHEQRANGIYDRINVEMDRRKTLGLIHDGTSFLDAYRNIGDELHSAGRLLPQVQTQNVNAPQQQPRQPVASRPGNTRNVSAPNDAAARAASPARTSSKQPKPSFDPLSLTDAEIMAMDSPRF